MRQEAAAVCAAGNGRLDRRFPDDHSGKASARERFLRFLPESFEVVVLPYIISFIFFFLIAFTIVPAFMMKPSRTAPSILSPPVHHCGRAAPSFQKDF